VQIFESLLFINGEWRSGSDGTFEDVINPSNEEVVGKVAVATEADVHLALAAADKGFRHWKTVSPQQRKAILKKTALLVQQRKEELSRAMTIEQGKPLEESRGEIDRVVDTFEWCAEEATRTYGRLLPQRKVGSREMIIREPIGPVAAFAPWNFPAAMSVRKIAAAIGAGCSIIIKHSEESPAVCAGIAQACHDAGLPAGVLNLLYCPPSLISKLLIESPIIKKISLTGSVAVGRTLSSLAGQHLKPVTMELGGHAPVIIFEDADIEKAAALTAAFKYRNAGQVCLGVSRVFVHRAVYDKFLDCFLSHVKQLKVGDGMDPTTTMGPLANARQLQSMQRIMDDVKQRNGNIVCGGNRIGDKGYFWEPTVINNITDEAMLMTEEPFGPITPVVPFDTFDEVVERANQLSLGLAAYAFTNSLKTSTAIVDALDAGWLGINAFSPALAEAPFGGMKASGIGREGGPEGFAAYTQTKFVSQDAS
jgi:succinate-semialdehyde dehydrogenase/glutarate-semialdehyde dehydrogenase